MSGILRWIKSGPSKIFDPHRDARVRTAATEVEHRLAKARDRFVLEEAVKGLDLFEQDVPLVAREVYRSLLRRAWRDEKITDGDQRTIRWAAEKLRLDAKVCNELRHDCGVEAFQKALMRSLEDGVLTEHEVSGLREIAAQFGWELGPLMRHCLSTESGDVLRRLFLTAIENGRLVESEWTRLVRTTESLGLTKPELLAAIQVQAERFVESLFANSKADGGISQAEETVLGWLLSNIISRPEFRDYIKSQVFIVQRDAAIDRGDLPSIQSRRLGLRAGEIIHAEVPCEVRRTKQLKSGPRTDVYRGSLTLTDYRLLYDSAGFALDINHRRVLDLKLYTNGFDLVTSGKGNGTYLPLQDSQLFTRMYAIAIRKANQTIVCAPDRSARAIPRDVRQRVWQQYGGRCAECGATDYLEFDHIIPVAKGGNSSEVNVQLLCRRCNGKKSDMI